MATLPAATGPTTGDQLNNPLKLTAPPTDIEIPKTREDVTRMRMQYAPEMGMAEAAPKVSDLQMQEGMATAKSAAADEYAAKANAALQAHQEQVAKFPYPEFHPTEDNVQTLGKMFSLVTVVGLLLGSSGKLGAMNAMAAMNGMMMGWRQGRADLFKQEKEKFDKEMGRLKAIRADLNKDFDDMMKLLPTNKEAAILKAEMLARKAGTSSIIASYINKGEWDKVKAALDGAEKNIAAKEKLEAEARKVSIAAQLKGQGKAGYTSALLAGRAENIREAFVQAAKDMENVTMFRPGTVLGTFSGMTGQEGQTLMTSLANTFARKVTADDKRLMDQLVSGLEGNMAMALGGGYAQSAAKYRIDMYKRQIPKEGDSGYVAAMFLARVRQELNILADNFPSKPGATPEMSEKVIEANERINRKIPFTVEDVINAYYMSQKRAQSTALKSFATEAEAEAAAAAGKIKKGDKIIVGGQPATWE